MWGPRNAYDLSARNADSTRVVGVKKAAGFASLIVQAKQTTPETKAAKHIRISVAAEADTGQHAQIRELVLRSTN
jgi:hypothetical protein